jgi:hypothetical protein
MDYGWGVDIEQHEGLMITIMIRFICKSDCKSVCSFFTYTGYSDTESDCKLSEKYMTDLMGSIRKLEFLKLF